MTEAATTGGSKGPEDWDQADILNEAKLLVALEFPQHATEIADLRYNCHSSSGMIVMTEVNCGEFISAIPQISDRLTQLCEKEVMICC